MAEIIEDRNGREQLCVGDGRRYLDPKKIFINVVSGSAFVARDGAFSNLGPPGREDEAEMIRHWLAERGVAEPVVKIGGDG